MALLAASCRRPATAWMASATGVVALAGFAIEGHTRSQEPAALMVALDVIHVAAAAFWLGGIAGLVVAFRSGAGPERVGADGRPVQRRRRRLRARPGRCRCGDGLDRPAVVGRPLLDGLRTGAADEGGPRRRRGRPRRVQQPPAGAGDQRRGRGIRSAPAPRQDRAPGTGRAAGGGRRHLRARRPLARVVGVGLPAARDACRPTPSSCRCRAAPGRSPTRSRLAGQAPTSCGWRSPTRPGNRSIRWRRRRSSSPSRCWSSARCARSCTRSTSASTTSSPTSRSPARGSMTIRVRVSDFEAATATTELTIAG